MYEGPYRTKATCHYLEKQLQADLRPNMAHGNEVHSHVDPVSASCLIASAPASESLVAWAMASA